MYTQGINNIREMLFTEIVYSTYRLFPCHNPQNIEHNDLHSIYIVYSRDAKCMGRCVQAPCKYIILYEVPEGLQISVAIEVLEIPCGYCKWTVLSSNSFFKNKIMLFMDTNGNITHGVSGNHLKHLLSPKLCISVPFTVVKWPL